MVVERVSRSCVLEDFVWKGGEIGPLKLYAWWYDFSPWMPISAAPDQSIPRKKLIVKLLTKPIVGSMRLSINWSGSQEIFGGPWKFEELASGIVQTC